MQPLEGCVCEGLSRCLSVGDSDRREPEGLAVTL